MCTLKIKVSYYPQAVTPQPWWGIANIYQKTLLSPPSSEVFSSVSNKILKEPHFACRLEGTAFSAASSPTVRTQLHALLRTIGHPEPPQPCTSLAAHQLERLSDLLLNRRKRAALATTGVMTDGLAAVALRGQVSEMGAVCWKPPLD